MKKILQFCLMLPALFAGSRGRADHAADIAAAHETEFEVTALHIKNLSPAHAGHARLRAECQSGAALILETDRDPVDVLLRRTRALLHKLKSMDGAPDLEPESGALNALAAEEKKVPVAERDRRKALALRLCALRREIAFKNPLLDFDRIVLLTKHRPRRGDHHMVDQYYGFNARPGGRLLVLADPFGKEPRAENILADSTVSAGRLKGRKLEGGAFNTLDLDYDGESLLFAWTECGRPPAEASWDGQPWTEELARKWKKPFYFWHPRTVYHIFKVAVDGSGLTQLTDGMWNDFDPCFLPSGRIAFISERRGGFLRCGGNRPNPSYTLFGMMPDGSDIITLSYHETNEWNPSVDNSGMIAYTRWDYVDRDNDIAHHIWLCFPDGRDPRSYHGNYPRVRESRPWMELSIRAIPGSHRYVALAAPHHGYNYGSMILIDQRVEDDSAMSQLKRITPEVLFPESEKAPGVPHGRGGHNPIGEVYGSPWPLSEDFHLCVYDPAMRHYGLYLVDCFGNRIFIYRDPEAACLDPIPLRPRPRPHVIPAQTRQAKADRRTGGESKSTIAVMNIYESDFEWPKETRIDALRIVQLFPKATYHLDDPEIGAGDESLARGVIGTVPVEEDGSVHFEAPAGVPLYFQALDGDGLAVQSMRSATYLHEGERLSCVGCHEPKSSSSMTTKPAIPLALRKPPAKPAPGPDGSNPLSFARLVQPVLNRACVACHAREPDAPSLAGDRFGQFGWSEAFHTLRPFSWSLSGGNGIIAKNGSRSTPGKMGARASRLYSHLGEGHNEVELSAEDLQRIVIWLDCNSNFYGAYLETDRQARGEIVLPAVH